MSNYIFTSESVSEGHPDKVADQISDSILDSFLNQDSKSRVACETLLAPGLIVVSGEVNTKCYVDIAGCAKNVLKNIGYNHAKKGLDYKSVSVLTTINQQSPDISRAVGFGEEQGAGDQGIIFGYAIDETPEFMPLSIFLSHQLVKDLARLRKSGHDFLWPDSKSQVSVQYKNGKVDSISHVVVSTQHSPDITLDKLREFIVEELIKKNISKDLLKSTQYIINPGGEFIVGGPEADTGLTGRKIIVDTYGGHGSHGGGCFSGKDPSKVDRSAAYVARHIAKNLVANKLLSRCLVQLSYAIGKVEPVSLYIRDYGTSTMPIEKIYDIVNQNWDLSPSGIIKELDLLKPIYQKTATYGHFGRDDVSWEKIKTLKGV